MSEVTEQQAQTSEGEGKNTAAGSGEATATRTAGEQQAQTAERTFSQADVDRIIRERLAAEKQREQKKAEEEDAKRRGDFEKLLKDKEAEAETLRAELAKERHEALKARVAAKHGLPPALAARLQGEDEAALEKDAEELAKFKPQETRTGLPPAGGRNPGAQDPDRPPTENERQAHLAHTATRF